MKNPQRKAKGAEEMASRQGDGAEALKAFFFLKQPHLRCWKAPAQPESHPGASPLPRCIKPRIVFPIKGQ